MGVLRITWKKSAIGYDRRQRRVIQALGLNRLHQTVVHIDSPTIRGMVGKVPHLLDVEKLDQASAEAVGEDQDIAGR